MIIVFEELDLIINHSEPKVLSNKILKEAFLMHAYEEHYFLE